MIIAIKFPSRNHFGFYDGFCVKQLGNYYTS